LKREPSFFFFFFHISELMSSSTFSLHFFTTLVICCLLIADVYCVNTCSSVNCGVSSCCSDAINGPLCYDSAQYDCVGGAHLCQKGYLACGAACYSPSTYSCVAGQLQAVTSPTSAPSTVHAASTVTSAPTASATTVAPTSSPTTASPTTASPTTHAAPVTTSAAPSVPAKPLLSSDFFANTTVYTQGVATAWEAYYYSLSTGKWRIDYATSITYLQRLDLGSYFQILSTSNECIKYNDVANFTSYWAWVENATYAGSCTTNGVTGNQWQYKYSSAVANVNAAYYLCESNAVPLNFTSVSVSLQGVKQTQWSIYNLYAEGSPADEHFGIPDACSA